MDIFELRRDLHAHPEVGFTEFRTANRVVRELQSYGYSVAYGIDVMVPESRRGLPSADQLTRAYQRAKEDGADETILRAMDGGLTGVVATLKGRGDGPTVAFRFDMDALPIMESQESTHLPHINGFRSVHDGEMHACGHDGHTAIGLTFAKMIASQPFNGTLKLIFQPAEEGGRGAKSMVDKGVVDDVDKLFCFHLGLDLPLHAVSGGTNEFLASTKLEVHYQGVSAHAAAAPEKGRNALLGAATALLNIHALPRFSSGATRVNVGVLEGGTAPNIIPDKAKMVLECRAETYEDNLDLEQRVRAILEHSALMHGLTYQIENIGEAATAVCDPELKEVVLEAAKSVPFFTDYQDEHPLGASEDATFLMRRVQERGGKVTYSILGTTIAAPHHNPKFDIDEEILPAAVDLLLQIAIQSLK
ncbi:amidohydrolase [Alicyclobacillus ferrooxydans]|uniref:Aminobenzoyl-glutamate utilization protein A n=1 Tax=Alicyclobacillus ferrooxydans TaxID=471514 RepID=A0A0P9CW41_9BACL|nr:amidohydrolase [Alicyclobacillus ferrooxydans]KPV44001.1 aminobenzoyl-glutamate utilization protein A [Alicyclobacillus ferrooxydans]